MTLVRQVLYNKLINAVYRFMCAILIALTLFLQISPLQTVKAAPVLTVTPLTWNIVGLDSNNVNSGPNNFPVGARVCNTGDAADNVTATFSWDDGNNLYTGDTYINLRSGSLSSIQTPADSSHSAGYLAAGTAGSPSCYDFYFEVTVTRNSSAYEKTRDYHINVTADGPISVNTPDNRQIYVEHLISQNRNSTNEIYYDTVPSTTRTKVLPGGTMALLVGETYKIELYGSTATQGYNQLEDFINFPNTVFQVLSVASHYSADSSTYVANSSDKLYADGCLWDNDTTSPTYKSCIGSDGKIGGSISTTYTVKIIGGAGASQSLGTLIYDFSGSSFHYNSDFASSSFFVTVSTPASMTKSFSPSTITTSGGTLVLSVTINNSIGTQLNNVSLTDTFPSGITVAATPNVTTSAGCVSPSFSPHSPLTGESSFTYTGSVAAAGCTISMNVTASTDGTYTNKTDNLLIDSADTGVSASANLTVATSTGGGETCGVVIDKWTFPHTTSTSGTATYTANLPSGATDVATFTTSSKQAIDNTLGSTLTDGSGADSWSAYGWTKNSIDPSVYYKFAVTTTNYTKVQMKLSAYRTNNGPSDLYVYYYKAGDSFPGSAYQSYVNILSTATTWFPLPGPAVTDTIDFTSLTNTSGITNFLIMAKNSQNTSSDAELFVDDITFTGCTTLNRPTLTKLFTPDTILAGETSTLSITLHNTNASDLTGALFSDVLPTDMVVASTPSASNTCSGTFSPAAGDTTLSLSGGTIPAGGTCTASVKVTASAVGTYTNTTGYVSTTETGINTTDGSGSDDLTVNAAPPVITKEFSPKTIPVNGTASLVFSISNPNATTTLTGVNFSDTFPANLTVSGTPTTTCSGGDLTSSTSTSIILTGASIPGGGQCTVNANVTSATVNTSPGYVNSVQVKSTTAGDGNTASDTIYVRNVSPAINLLKQVGSSASGPWLSNIDVAASGNVYYRFSIENTGDVDLSPVWVTDPSLDVSSCSWPSTLPAASATSDPTATCVVGPVTASSTVGNYPNTATAHGTYSGSTSDSTTSSASYDVTSLLLEKSVTETFFTAAGETLNYSYKITNNGGSAITGAASVVDSNTSVSCPVITSLAAGASITCTGSYTTTAFDVSVGSVTNTAYAKVGSTTSNTDQTTVSINKPDLVVAKTNNTSGQATNGVSFRWTLTVTNNGASDAVFDPGERILEDTLPSGPSYTVNTPSLAGISCTKTGLTVECTATSTVTISAGSSFTETIDVVPASTGSLTNSTTVNPDYATTSISVSEANTGNNNGSDTVVVSAPLPDLTITKTNNTSDNGTTNVQYNWVLTVTNSGGSNAVFASGQKIITDTLPSGPTYGSITVNTTGITGTVTCPVTGSTVNCSASGGSVTIASGQSFTVTIPVTPLSAGSLSNTAYVDPDHNLVESNSGNNSSSNTVTVTSSPNISLSKTNGATTVTADGTTTYSLTVSNTGGQATSGTITVVDVLPSGMTIGSGAVTLGGAQAANWTCNASGQVITCTSSTAIAATTGTSVFSFTVNVDGTASGTLDNKAKAGGGGDPSTTTPDSTNTSACTGTDTPTKGCSVDSDTVLKPILGLAKTNGTTTVTKGSTTTYTLTVSNTGNLATSGTITIVDVLPTGMSISNGGVTLGGAQAANWTCNASSNIITCTSSTSIVATTGTSVFSFEVNVSSSASGTLTNKAQVGGGGDPTASTPTSTTAGACTATNTPTRGCAVDDDTAIDSPSLSISKSNGSTTVPAGGTTTYTLVVSNTGGQDTSGTITIVDVLLNDLSINNGAVTLGGAQAANWTCNASSNVITCTSSTVIAATTGTSTISFTVNVAGSATVTQNNKVQVGGGGDPATSTPTSTTATTCTGTDAPIKGCAVDSDSVSKPILGLSKSDSVSSITAGGTTAYTLTVSNTGRRLGHQRDDYHCGCITHRHDHQ